MREFRLLVDFEVVEFLIALPLRQRKLLHASLQRIWNDPTSMSDYRETDAVGRFVEIHLCRDYAIKYWIDHAACHIKILDIYPADWPRS